MTNGLELFYKAFVSLHNITLRDNEVATQFTGDKSTVVRLQGISDLFACFSKHTSSSVHIL